MNADDTALRRRTRLGAAVALTAFVLASAGVGGAGAQTEAGDAEVAPTPVASWGTTGSGPGQFRGPGVAGVGPDGTVYVSDGFFGGPENDRIQAFSADGSFIRAWGAPEEPTNEGPGEFTSGPRARVAPDGTVYAQDEDRDSNGDVQYRVQRFTPEGAFIDVWTHGHPDAFTAAGNLLVRVDDNSYREVDPTGASTRQWTLASARRILGIGVGPDGKIYASFDTPTVGDPMRVAVLSTGGTLIRSFAVLTSGDVAVHPDGYVLVSGLAGLFRYTTAGALVDQWTAAAASNLRLGDAGEVLIGETLADRVRIVTPVGPDRWKRKADAQIGTGGALAGNNIYNLTGAGQTKSNTTCSSQYLEAGFAVRMQNDGNVADRFTVKSPAGNSRFTVRHASAAGTVTSRVVAGTFRTPLLLPGETYEIGIFVKATAGTPRGASITQTATVTSVADPTKKDVVKYTATRGAC
ncbi:MAG: hypothetical protein JNK12_17260 [Acidimicrobiales bacterium]|nr:hypothetical protein [Acidimicrobiales bacterium]